MEFIQEEEKSDYAGPGIFTAREGNTVVLEGYGRIMEDIIRISSKDTEDTMVVEKKYLIKSDFYQTLLSEMTGYMEVDLDSGIIHNSGGIWKRYGTGRSGKASELSVVG